MNTDFNLLKTYLLGLPNIQEIHDKINEIPSEEVLDTELPKFTDKQLNSLFFSVVSSKEFSSDKTVRSLAEKIKQALQNRSFLDMSGIGNPIKDPMQKALEIEKRNEGIRRSATAHNRRQWLLKLPQNVVYEILKYMAGNNLFKCMQVCTDIAKHRYRLFAENTAITITLYRKYCFNALIHTTSTKNTLLENLIKNFSHLMGTLDLSRCEIQDHHLIEVVKTFPRIKILALSWCTKITDTGVNCLKDLLYLQQLDLSCSTITGTSFRYLGQLRYLHTLNLTACQKIDSLGFQNIQHLKHLQTITLANTPISDHDSQLLVKTMTVENFSFACCNNISQRILSCNWSKKLKVLNLTDCVNIPEELRITHYFSNKEMVSEITEGVRTLGINKKE